MNGASVTFPVSYTHLTMPLDIVQNRIFLECHYYDPYDFTIMPNDENFKSQWGAAFAALITSTTLFLGSCSDFLDRSPQGQFTEDDNPNALVNGKIYNCLLYTSRCV